MPATPGRRWARVAPATAEHGADEPPLDSAGVIRRCRSASSGRPSRRASSAPAGPRRGPPPGRRCRSSSLDARVVLPEPPTAARGMSSSRRVVGAGTLGAAGLAGRRRRRLVAAGDRHDRRRHDAQHDSRRRCGTPGTLDRRLRASAGSRGAPRRRSGRARRALRRLARTSPPSVRAGAAGSIRTRCSTSPASTRPPTSARAGVCPLLHDAHQCYDLLVVSGERADGQWMTVTRRPTCRSSPGGSRRSRRSCRLPRVR